MWQRTTRTKTVIFQNNQKSSELLRQLICNRLKKFSRRIVIDGSILPILFMTLHLIYSPWYAKIITKLQSSSFEIRDKYYILDAYSLLKQLAINQNKINNNNVLNPSPA